VILPYLIANGTEAAASEGRLEHRGRLRRTRWKLPWRRAAHGRGEDGALEQMKVVGYGRRHFSLKFADRVAPSVVVTVIT
jgi:hypothetical protein